MHNQLAERHQFQRLDKPLAGNVLAKKPASSCFQRGQYVIRRRIGGKDDSFHPRGCRYYSSHEVDCGRAHLSTPINQTQLS